MYLYFAVELKLAFNLFDKDRDGVISVQEVDHCMRSLGQECEEEKLRKMFREVDLDGMGSGTAILNIFCNERQN